MSAVTLRPAGIDALRRRLAALSDEARAAAAPGLSALAEGVADEVRDSLDARSQGPDDLPARLAASVSATPTEGGSAVTVAAPEAMALEYGTLHRAARPILRPIAGRAGPAGVALLAAALRHGLRR